MVQIDVERRLFVKVAHLSGNVSDLPGTISVRRQTRSLTVKGFVAHFLQIREQFVPLLRQLFLHRRLLLQHGERLIVELIMKIVIIINLESMRWRSHVLLDSRLRLDDPNSEIIVPVLISSEALRGLVLYSVRAWFPGKVLGKLI